MFILDQSDDDEEDEENIDYKHVDDLCVPCEANSSKESTKKKKDKSSDIELKEFALNTPFWSVSHCNPKECKYGGECVQDMTIGDIRRMKADFWGDNFTAAPFSSTRRLLLIKILRSSFRVSRDEFEFYVGQKDKNVHKTIE